MGETHSRIAVQLSTRPIIPIGIAPVKSKDCIDAGYPVRLYRQVNGIRGDLPQIRSIIRQAPPLPDPIVAADRNPSEWLNAWESQLALLSLASSDRCACPGPGVLKNMQGNTPLRGSQKRWIKLTANDAYIIGVGWALELPLAARTAPPYQTSAMYGRSQKDIRSSVREYPVPIDLDTPPH
jgi:hypothetical protein